MTPKTSHHWIVIASILSTMLSSAIMGVNAIFIITNQPLSKYPTPLFSDPIFLGVNLCLTIALYYLSRYLFIRLIVLNATPDIPLCSCHDKD